MNDSDVRISVRVTARRRDDAAAAVGVTVAISKMEYCNSLTGYVTPVEAIALANDLIEAAGVGRREVAKVK